MSPDETGPEGQEIPLRPGRRQHILRVDLQPVEDNGKLVHQCDIEVALRVLDHFRRLGNFHRGGLVGSRRNDTGIERIDRGRRLRCRAARHLHDIRQPVFPVAGVYPLRAIAGEKILIQLQAGTSLENRYANLARAARIDGRFVNHDRSLGHCLAHRFRCTDQISKVRPVRLVDRRRHRDDEDAAIAQVGCIAGKGDMARRIEIVRPHFPGVIFPASKFGDTRRLAVEAGDGPRLAELDSKRQPDIAKADHGNTKMVELHEKTNLRI